MKAIILVLAILFSIDGWGQEYIPNGWRTATSKDYESLPEWKYYKNDFPIPYYVSGDFDGDGTADDHAWILINTSDNTQRGIFIFLNNNGNYEQYFLGEASDYLTLLQRGAEICSFNEQDECTEKIITKYDGIYTGGFEYEGVIFYLNQRKNKYIEFGDCAYCE